MVLSEASCVWVFINHFGPKDLTLFLIRLLRFSYQIHYLSHIAQMHDKLHGSFSSSRFPKMYSELLGNLEECQTLGLQSSSVCVCAHVNTCV